MLTSRNYKILIVDDSVAIVKYLEYILSSQSFKLIVAHNAEDCITLVNLEKPDIVFLDINLPRMNGLVACRILKDKFPDLPIIIITSELDSIEKHNAFQAGADDFIILFARKP